jgi:CHAT domain-containing protein
MTRGFMYAGAARVVSTLWNADDQATAAFMKRFYSNMLRQGLKPAAALRSAQLAMWHDSRWNAAYFWAGFTLQGEWN